MPLQKSFRNKPNAPAGSSRSRGSAGDKVPAGSFRQTIKDILDDVSSKAAEAPDAQGKEIAMRAEDHQPTVGDVAEKSDKAPLADQVLERSGAKRARFDSSDRNPRPKNVQGSWTFTHNRPKSILDDQWELATLLRHMKPIGCAFPAVNHLFNSEGYRNVAFFWGQLGSALNQSFLGYENQLKKGPDSRELNDVKEAFERAKEQLDQSKARIQNLQSMVDELKTELGTVSGKLEDFKLEVNVKAKKISNLESSKRTAEAQIQDLMNTNQEMKANKAAEVRLAVRRGKKEMVEAYGKVLQMVKEKFQRKKEEATAQIPAQEIQANIELLEGLISEEIASAKEEHDRLVAMFPEAMERYEKAQVSDFTVSKLPLPQISEASDVRQDPERDDMMLDEHGTNIGSVGAGEALEPMEVEKPMNEGVEE